MAIRTYFFILFLMIGQFFVFAQNEEIALLKELENNIDSIVNNAIRQQAFPGCIVFASIGDSTLINRPFGYHTYDSLKPVMLQDLYDLASITKVTAATLALMKLYEADAFRLDDKLKEHLKGAGKLKNLTFRELLAHQAGLQSWIPYYQRFRKKNGKYKRGTISVNPRSKGFIIDNHQYLDSKIYSKIKKEISSSKVDKKPKYQYSGLFFYLIPELVKNLTGLSFDQYLRKMFYDPMGCETLVFNPLDQFSLDRITPTEIDTFFRMSPIHGKVHDEGAILMGGVSGNAGLFSNVTDLSKIWRMLLDNGEYGGVSYLKPSTIQLFTSYQYPHLNNRRGLGFDKPLLEYNQRVSSVSKDASILSYGHTGYTGTLVWADPKTDLLFIFLTNRVYPDRSHKKIYELNVRPVIHQKIYDLVLKLEH